MFKRIKAGWALTKKSWGVIKENPTLMVFPVVSAITSFIFLCVVFVPAGAVIFETNTAGDLTTGDNGTIAGVIAGIVVAYLTTTVTVFFNVALVAAAVEVFEGREGSVRIGLSKAWERKKAIIGWAFLSATVGLLLRLIADKVGGAGAVLIEAVGGFAWAIASWFVIPSLAVEGLGPIKSLKSSAHTIKKRWGEGVVGIIAIGGIFGVMFLASVLVTVGVIILLSSANAPVVAYVAFGLVAFVVLLSLMLIQMTLHQVFNTAVFLSIKENNRDVGPFSAQEIESAAIRKPGHKKATPAI